MTDKLYRKWMNTLESCLDGDYSEYVNDDGLNPACHVLRAGKSGKAYKASYSCVPMTQKQHLYQHQHGELAVLIRYGKNTGLTAFTVEAAKQWFDEKVILYREQWHERIKVG